jgi:hypothetical protein
MVYAKYLMAVDHLVLSFLATLSAASLWTYWEEFCTLRSTVSQTLMILEWTVLHLDVQWCMFQNICSP